MARQIDLENTLSDEEVQYLVDRNRWDDLAYNAEATGGEPVVRGTNPISPQADSARLGDQTVTEVPNGSNPAPASLGQRQKREGNTERVEETEDRPYEDWSKDKLKDQANKRGLNASGNKQDLSDRLRANDEEVASETDDGSGDEDGDGSPDE